MASRLLFLCTGNFYRSRFAEVLFNHRAAESMLTWVADSRGLATEQVLDGWGPMAPFAIDALAERGIYLAEPRLPRSVTEADMRAADRVIALKEAEHRPLLAERLPGWEDRVTYWHIDDVDGAEPEIALSMIDAQVSALIEEFADALALAGR